MLKRLIGNEKEYKPALDSMLDKMLIFVKTSGIETIQHKTDYLQNKRAPGDKSLFELIKDFFPHLGVKYSPDQILIQLEMMIQKILRHSALGLPIEDKYQIGYKRYGASGGLCPDLFSKLLKQFLKSVRNKLQKYLNVPTDENIQQIILSTSSTITNKLRFNFATEEWMYQQGVSQVIEPHTAQWSYISHIRKIVLQIGKDSKNQGPRKIHASSMPFTCPVETPEGAQHVGAVNRLSIGTTVTSRIFNVSMIVDLIWDCLEPLSTLIDKPCCNQVMVVINGRPVGLTKMANNICNLLEDFGCARVFFKTCIL